MSAKLTKKLVLITGASSGIGQATAERYGNAGAHVLLLARNAESLNAVAASIRKAGGTATVFPIDLADADATMELSAGIKRDIGIPDILINNAGAGRWLPLAATSPEDAATMMTVPYLAAFNMTRAFLPDMVARGRGGVAFITSPTSYLAWPNTSAYTAARRALAGFAETLQSELVGKGVTVTLVVLGAVETPYWENNPGSRENLPQANPALVPVLTPEQAAKAIVDGVERKRLFVIKPGIYRALFVLNALFPQFTARQLRQPAPKPSAEFRLTRP